MHLLVGGKVHALLVCTVGDVCVARVGGAGHAAHLKDAVQACGFVVGVGAAPRRGVWDGVTAARAGVGRGFLGEA